MVSIGHIIPGQLEPKGKVDTILTDVAFKALSVGGVNTFLTDLRDWGVREIAVVSQEGLQVAGARSDTPAAELPLRNEHVA